MCDRAGVQPRNQPGPQPNGERRVPARRGLPTAGGRGQCVGRAARVERDIVAGREHPRTTGRGRSRSVVTDAAGIVSAAVPSTVAKLVADTVAVQPAAGPPRSSTTSTVPSSPLIPVASAAAVPRSARAGTLIESRPPEETSDADGGLADAAGTDAAADPDDVDVGEATAVLLGVAAAAPGRTLADAGGVSGEFDRVASGADPDGESDVVASGDDPVGTAELVGVGDRVSEALGADGDSAPAVGSDAVPVGLAESLTAAVGDTAGLDVASGSTPDGPE